MNLKQMTIIGAAWLVVVTAFGQLAEEPGSGGATLKPLVENLPFDRETQLDIRRVSDNETRLAAIRALTPTTRAQSNWVAGMEAMTLADWGEEEQAVAAAGRIADPEWAAMTEFEVRVKSSNGSKVLEVGQAWMAKPEAELGDVNRIRMADVVAQAMKASGGDDLATRSNSVRVLTAALSTIGHTTYRRHVYDDKVAVHRPVVEMVKRVRLEGAPEADQAAMLRNLVRVTPVTKLTVKTVGEWKGWLAWHGDPDAEVNELIVGNYTRGLLDLHAADEVSRALEHGKVADGPARSNCVRVLTRALSQVEPATLTKLDFKETQLLPRLLVRLVKFVLREDAPDAEQEAMLRHLIQITPVTKHTFGKLGEWKGWLARHGREDVV